MPNAQQWLRDGGLITSWEHVNEKRFRVLTHLLEPPAEYQKNDRPTPRLYIKEGKATAHLTYSAHNRGWHTRVDMDFMIGEKLIEVDISDARTCLHGVTSYRISEKGREMVAQVRAYQRLKLLLLKEVPKILTEERLRVGLKSKSKK